MKNSVFALLLFCSFSGAAVGQIFYLQPFTGGTFPPGWSATSTRVVINNQVPSSGYDPPPASGGNNVRMNDCLPLGETVELNVSGVISTVGRTGIRVGFGHRRSMAHATPVSLAWSSDGVNWNTLGDVADGATTTWSALFFDLPAAAENVSNLRFRFSYVTQVNTNCTAPPNFRIDDFAVGENFSLPVELLDFSAQAEGSTVRLKWATASEYQSAYFEVERSRTGEGFGALGRVAANGNTSEVQYYEFTDDKPLPGLNYYRLRLVDVDGAFSYSAMRRVFLPEYFGRLRLFPSPATEVVHVGRNAEFPWEEGVRWEIFDLLGRLCMQGFAAQPTEGWSIPLHELPVGQYLLRCTTTGMQETHRFQKR